MQQPQKLSSQANGGVRPAFRALARIDSPAPCGTSWRWPAR